MCRRATGPDAGPGPVVRNHPAADQNRNVKVREIAELAIAGITGQPPQEPPFGLPHGGGNRQGGDLRDHHLRTPGEVPMLARLRQEGRPDR